MALPPQSNATYAPSARKLLNAIGPRAYELSAVARDETLPVEARFNAFYCMQAQEWRLRNYSAHRRNTDEFQSVFFDQPMFDFMQAEYYSVAGHEISNLETALLFAKQATQKLPSVPGILHLYAELVCTYTDRAGIKRSDLLAEADRSVARAIALDPNYPKYFATRATVSLLRGAFNDAAEQVAIAIDREDSDNPNYALRIGDYQLVRSRISYAVEYEQIKSTQEQAIVEFRQMRSQVLGILGLLAAVIALIASSSSIAAAATPSAAPPLLLIAGAVVLIVFWGFHYLFVGMRTGIGVFVPLIVGLFLGIIGFIWPLLTSTFIHLPTP